MGKHINKEEIELINGCLQSNRFAQKKLYDKYKDAMYTLAYRILRNENDACDALQEGFIEVFKNLDTFEGKSTLGAWIKTIIIRKTLRNIRKEDRYETFDDNFKDMRFEWDENLTGHELDKAINKLSPGYRSVFVLIEVEGYSHKETAKMLGISEGTSKSQLYWAKKHLQQLLKDLKN